ncbi:protein phosphatase 2C 2 [Mycena floridula]|nr:protein phosphatase 2C 2 [Mycena floridula]
MGNYLSAPETDKACTTAQNSRFHCMVVSMQGWRINMEDAHIMNLDIDPTDSPNSFFAVFDGHSGQWVAQYAAEHMSKMLVEQTEYQQQKYPEALKSVFLAIDEELLQHPKNNEPRSKGGSTAVGALITRDTIHVANAGDSRAVLCVKGTAKDLSFDHKPGQPVEDARIKAAGGYVEFGRVNGNLNMSRALGDFKDKMNKTLTPQQQALTADPEVISHTITSEDEFLVLACDGIWDCLSSQQVVDIIRHQTSLGKTLTEIGEIICELCLAPICRENTVGTDNMTIVIVSLLEGRTIDKWSAWITERVKTAYGYTTPSALPSLYPAEQVAAFQRRQEENLRRERIVKENRLRVAAEAELVSVMDEAPVPTDPEPLQTIEPLALEIGIVEKTASLSLEAESVSLSEETGEKSQMETTLGEFLTE